MISNNLKRNEGKRVYLPPRVILFELGKRRFNSSHLILIFPLKYLCPGLHGLLNAFFQLFLRVSKTVLLKHIIWHTGPFGNGVANVTYIFKAYFGGIKTRGC